MEKNFPNTLEELLQLIKYRGILHKPVQHRRAMRKHTVLSGGSIQILDTFFTLSFRITAISNHYYKTHGAVNLSCIAEERIPKNTTLKTSAKQISQQSLSPPACVRDVCLLLTGSISRCIYRIMLLGM